MIDEFGNCSRWSPVCLRQCENYSRSFSRLIIWIYYFTLVLQSRAGFLEPFTGALGSDRPDDDIADGSLAVNEKRCGGAEDAIGPLDCAVHI
jgi:hypothetical protein